MGRTFRRLAGLLLTVTLAGAGCASGGDGDDGGDSASGGTTESTGDQDGAVSGGEFSVALGEPDHLLPANATSTNAGQVLSALFTGLVEYDVETAEPRNAMAIDITTSDSVTWTIELAPGWTFHDGEEVTAESYVDAWNFAAYAPNANGNASFFSKVDGYDAVQGDPDADPPVEPSATELSGLAVVDETTFTVKLSEPFSQLPLTLGYHAYFPMPSTGLADPKAFNEAPVGNGPFQMDGSWEHDQSIRMVRYDDYGGKKAAAADAVEFRIISGDDTGFRELQAGGLDIATNIPLAEVDAARDEYGDRFVERKSPAFAYLGFPNHDAKFRDAGVRRAISMAIDRPAIVKAIYSDTKEPAGSVIAPLVPGARADACGYCALDAAAAKDLLAGAGGWEGTLNLWYATSDKNTEALEAVANQLRNNLGISDIAFQQVPFAELLAKIKARDIDGPFLLSWLMDYPSPQSYLEPLYQSESSSNRSGYSSEEFDQLVAEANRAPSLEEGLVGYQAAEDVVLADMPVVPLWFGLTQAVHSERLGKVRIDPFSRIRVADVVVED